jgi:hypothetical protein
MSGRSRTELDLSLTEALRPLVAELVAEELERRLDELAGPEWLTLEEAADRYHTTTVALRARARRGQLPGAVKDGSRWLLDRREYDRSLAPGTLAPDNRNGRAPR